MYSQNYSSPLQAAGGSLFANQGGYQQDDPQAYSPTYNNNNYSQAHLNSRQTNRSTRLEDLDILDQYSKPLLQRQGGEIYIPPNSIQDIPAVPLHPNRYPSTVPVHAMQVRPQSYNRPSSKELKIQKSMENQMKQQNLLLSQLVQQQQQFQMQNQNQLHNNQHTNRDQNTEFNRRIGDMTREQTLLNEIANLRREVGSLQASTRQQPFPQQQMLMQQMLMNQLQNPYAQNPMGRIPPPPVVPQPEQLPKRNIDDNRLEEMVLSLLRERALTNAVSDDLGRPTRNYRQPDEFDSPVRPSNSDRYIPRQQPYDFSNRDDPPRNRRQPTPQQKPPTPQKRVTRQQLQKAKRLLQNYVLFIRYIREEVRKSRLKLRTYEIEEFQGDLSRSTSGAISWFADHSVRGLKQIIVNTKSDQEITDTTAMKLSAKDQELRFKNYTDDCDALIDDMIANVEDLHETTQLFMAKKFFDSSYLVNNPPFLFEFERDRLLIDSFDGRLNGIDKNPESPMFKMLCVVYMIVKVFIPLLIAPWQYDEIKQNKQLVFNQNQVMLKKLAIMCTIFYVGCLDHLKETVSIPNISEEEQIARRQQSGIVTWAVIKETLIINNNNKIMNLKTKKSTKNDMLTLLVEKEELSLFFTKKQQWFAGFKQKFSTLASAIRKSLRDNRKAYLELRKEMLQEKAKQFQHFIPARMRNVQLK